MDYKTGYFDAGGNAIVGSGDLTLRVQRDADYWFLDFNDMAFKAAGHVAIDLAMAEPDAVNAPGWYWGTVDDAVIATWNDGVYTVYVNCAGVAAPPPWADILEFRIVGGVVTTGAAESLSAQCITQIQGITIDGTIDFQDALTIMLAMFYNAEKVAGVWQFRDQSGNIKVEREASRTEIDTIFH